MKRNFVKTILITLFLLSAKSIFSQDISKTLAELSSAAAVKYSEPVITAFGSGVNAGWFSGLPSPTNSFHAKVRFVGVGTLFRDDIKRFSTTGEFRFTSEQVDEILIASGLSPSTITNYVEIKNEVLSRKWDVNISGPTINGDDQEFIQILFPGTEIAGETIESYTVTLDDVNGFLNNKEFLPTPALQIDLSSVLGTGISFRYFKGIDIYDLGQMNIWGGGLVHNLNYWFEDSFPVDIGFGYYFQKFNVGDIFSNTATQFGFYISKELGSPVVSIVPYASLTYESSHTTIDYTYEFDTPIGAQNVDVFLDYDKDTAVGLIIGSTLNLSIISINFDFKIAKTQTGTVALGFGF